MNFTIHQLLPSDLNWVREVYLKWGAEFIVTCGRKVYWSDVAGFYAAIPDGSRVGLVTYQISEGGCEVITLDAFERYAGIGTELMHAAEWAARNAGCRRLWFITTNDNLDAIRFYQRRRYTLAEIHANAIAESRKLKPSIPLVGSFGIPIRDELVFEKQL